LDTLLLNKDIGLAASDKLIVISLAARLTVKLIEDMAVASTPHRARYGPDAMCLTLLKPNVALPDDAAREHLRVVNARPDSARTSVVVIDEPGFWAAAMRGILAGMALASPTAPRGAPSVGDALATLAPRLSTGSDLAELERVILGFRATHLALR